MPQGHRQAEIGVAVVPNPFFASAHEVDFSNPTHITVAVNVKESAITSLANRGYVEPHQVAAATRFRRHFEVLQGGRSSSAGFQERVDGGGFRGGFGQRQMEAGAELRKARQLLGQRGFVLVALVAGEGRHLNEICRSKRERVTTADCLRAFLDDLSWLWGYRR
jgi:hypothetical protein